MAPFAAAVDGSEESLAALPGLCGTGELWLAERERMAPPRGTALVRHADGLQMVGPSVAPIARDHPSTRRATTMPGR